MHTQALLLELLVSGFFAIACFRARADGSPAAMTARPRDFFRLTDRVERLSRSRWQWFSMVGIIALVRMQMGVPIVVELTAAAQFVLFLALPTAKEGRKGEASAAPKGAGRGSSAQNGKQRRSAAMTAQATH